MSAPIRRPAVVALDVGGTAIKSLIADTSGVLHRHTTPTRAGDGPDAALAAVLEEVDRSLAAVPATHAVVGIGIAVPGTVDEETGTCLVSENLGWRQLPVRDIVAARTGLSVGFGHDVRAGGLAEWRMGAGRGVPHLAYLSVGTGICAALVLENRLIVSDGYVGEVGHGGAATGEECACGGQGCPETYASAAAVARRYSRATGTPVGGAREVLQRAEAGDAVARAVWGEAIQGLAVLVTDIVRVTGVRRVVVGGGMAQAGEVLLEPLRGLVRARLNVHRQPEIVPAELGGEAGAWGAVLLGWQAAEQDPVVVAEGYARQRRVAALEAVR